MSYLGLILSVYVSELEIRIELTKIKEYLTQNIQDDDCTVATNIIQMIKAASNHNEKKKQPKETNYLNISSPKLINRNKSYCATKACTQGNDD